MTKIVKTIDKVTNHENMRRYLHKKASKGGGTITADSITPEILENEDTLKRIQNWGLSDEEISQLHVVSANLVLNTLEYAGDCAFDFEVNNLKVDNTAISQMPNNVFTQDDYEYIVYTYYPTTGVANNKYVVLKRFSINGGSTHFETFNKRMTAELSKNFWYFHIGVDTR